MRNRIRRLLDIILQWFARGSHPRPESAYVPAPPDNDLFISRVFLTLYAFIVGILAVILSATMSLIGRCNVEGTSCDPSFEGECGPGMECNAGMCVRSEKKPLCEVGEACGACECLGPSSCEAGVCTAPPAQHPVCEARETQQLIRDLVKMHAGCKASVGSSMTGCAAQDVRKFLIEHPLFQTIERTFPDATVITFPSGEPAARAPSGEGRGGRSRWPDAKTRDFYAARLRDAIPALEAANYILIFGRASPTASEVHDFSFAQSRVAWARDFIVQAAGKTVDERQRMAGKILDFSLGGASMLTFDDFAGRANLRFSTHRSAEQRRLAGAVARHKKSPLKPAERQELEELINRSVTIVAIPCTAAPGAAVEGK